MNIVIDAKGTDFAERIRKERLNIIVYGAGVIGKICAPDFLSSNELLDHVLFWVDEDVHKRERDITVNGKHFKIVPACEIVNTREPYVILVTSSRYSGILEYLGKQPYSDRLEVYILPMMSIRDFNPEKVQLQFREGEKIPKKLHYCWFGGDMPIEMKKNIESWKSFCPEYDLICWNEKNYDIDKCSFTKQAYENKKWAFLSDAIKLDVLYEQGGFYFDTDVELIRPLDELRKLRSFCCVEKWGVINFGGGAGSVPKVSIIKEMLELRLESPLFFNDGAFNRENSGYFESLPFIKLGFHTNNTYQLIEGISILPSDYFHPYDYMSRQLMITDNTYGIHNFCGSWL